MQGHPEVALLLVVMFVCYFRPGEPLTIQSKDVAPPHGHFAYTALNVFPSEREGRNKTGLADVSLLLNAPYVPYLSSLVALLAQARSGRPLFGCRYLNVKNLFEAAQMALRLPERFVLYQVRHGGPSHDMAFGYRSMAEIKARGQWVTDASVKRYEGHARLQQVEAQLSGPQARLAAGAPRRLEALLQSKFLQICEAAEELGAPSTVNGRAPWKSSPAAGISRKRLRAKVSPASVGM